MICVILGPPGSGKGTQAELIASALEVPHVSTGDLLRAEAEEGTQLGDEVAPLLAAGELVPDRLIERVLERRLRAPDAVEGAILDGYPRTVHQARSLDALLPAPGHGVRAVLVLEVDETTVMERLRHRAAEQHRSDDNGESIAERLLEYRERTEPVIGYYRSAAVPVLQIDGSPDVDAVHRQIVQALQSARGL
jgi:adenylate kinase